MQWGLMQKGWRALLIRTALVTLLWFAMAFVSATEIYLSARGEPIRISWTDAARSTFYDWFPWILLSPLAVFLAGRFRLGRQTWKRSLMIHLVSCLLFTAAYVGLLTLTSPGAVFVTGGRMVVATVSPPVPSGGFAGGYAFAPPSIPGSNTVFFFQHDAAFGSNAGPMLSVNSEGVAMVRDGPPPFPPSPGEFRFGAAFHPGFWTQFFHLAIMRTQFVIPIYWCMVCLCWTFGHFQETVERERQTLELEARLTQANLQALKMQLQPHFLFNTLNAVSSLIHENPKAADDMISSLSQFLRTTLNVSAKDEIPLCAELEFLEHYLEIQQTRFGERLKICREIEPGSSDALVPPLILQPLVENAIRHGIEPRERGGTVTIRTARKNNWLHLEISDDGEGFSGRELLRPGNGIGLSNTEARLQTLYGRRHQFTLTAIQPAGASAKIEIPFRPSQTCAQNRI